MTRSDLTNSSVHNEDENIVPMLDWFLQFEYRLLTIHKKIKEIGGIIMSGSTILIEYSVLTQMQSNGLQTETVFW